MIRNHPGFRRCRLCYELIPISLWNEHACPKEVEYDD